MNVPWSLVDRLALEPCLLVADRDLDLGHHRARGIAHDAGDLPGGRLGSRRTGDPEHDDQRDDDSYCCFHVSLRSHVPSRSGRRATARARTPSPRTAPSRRTGASTLPVRRSNDRKRVERSVGSRLMDGNNNRIRGARSAQRDVLTSWRTRRNRLVSPDLCPVVITWRAARPGAARGDVPHRETDEDHRTAEIEGYG